VTDSKPKIPTGGTPHAMPIPSVMLIAVDDATAATARASIPALQIRAASFDDANWRIPVARPLVIAVGAALQPEQAKELAELASAVGATVVQLASCVLPGDVRDRLVNAWRAAGAKRES
jgi:hypothetical protein